MATKTNEKVLKETPVSEDRNWTQRVNKEFNAVDEWCHTWNPVFFNEESNETYEDRRKARLNKIEELEKQVNDLNKTTNVNASLRTTSSDINGSQTLERFDVDKYYLKRNKELMSSDYAHPY